MEIIKKPGRFRPGWWTVLVGILLLLALLAAGAWDYFQAKLDKINYAGKPGGEEDWSDQAGGSGGIADLEYLNILLLGTDERTPGGTTKDFSPELMQEARADACMLLSLNLKAHTARLVSLERAIGVEIEGRGEDWLTHVFAFGGADAMLKTVREQFGVNVRRYARVNVSAAANLIDAIGGVDLTLTETEAAALNGEIYTNSTTHTRVHPGKNHLDGFDALAYARQRFIDDDFHRVQRQRNVLQAAIDQTKHLNLKQLDDLLDVALPLVETNFTKKEITALVPKAPGFLGVQLKQMTLPLKGISGNKQTDDGRSMMMLDPEESIRVLHEFFYGDFDPATYTAPQEVRTRVWQAQQKAAIEWAAAHPEAFASSEEEGSSSEDALDDEEPVDEGDRPVKRSASGLILEDDKGSKTRVKSKKTTKPALSLSSDEEPQSSKASSKESAKAQSSDVQEEDLGDRPAR